MPALDRLRGVRVIADPTALDGARWSGENVTILRFSPDEAFGLGATGAVVDDENAIVEPEAGFAGGWVDLADVAHHIEWSIPTTRPTLAQGSIAGVPAKLWLPDADRAFLLVAAAHAHDLQDRLGWGS